MASKVLLIGSGAREHCIAEALYRSKDAQIFSIISNKNPGLISLSKKFVEGDICDLKFVCNYAEGIKPDFAIIGPEAPLENGLANALWDMGIPCIGPKKSLARIETSKGYCRELMRKYDIEGLPDFKVFKSMSGLQEYMNTLPGVVVKPDGLTGGKGVWVEGDHFEDMAESLEYCQTWLQKGDSVVIEEKLEGEEFSQFYFSDGTDISPMPIAQDHKRAFEGDQGPNTGGMGSYSDANHLLPFITQKDVDDATTMTHKVIKALKDDNGQGYVGIIYGGYIKTKTGVKLIEYNARFGDPEVMNVLPLLKTDFVEICKSMIAGTLGKMNIEFEKSATVCKYVVPEGYPMRPVKNRKILVHNINKGIRLYYASVSSENGHLILKGSRAMAFVGVAKTIEEAEKLAQKGVDSVEGPIFFRRDIGTRDLIKKRIDHMKEILG